MCPHIQIVDIWQAQKEKMRKTMGLVGAQSQQNNRITLKSKCLIIMVSHQIQDPIQDSSNHLWSFVYSGNYQHWWATTALHHHWSLLIRGGGLYLPSGLQLKETVPLRFWLVNLGTQSLWIWDLWTPLKEAQDQSLQTCLCLLLLQFFSPPLYCICFMSPGLVYFEAQL